MEKLADEPKFATNPARVAHRKELVTILEGVFVQKTRRQWLKTLTDARLPAGPVYSMEEIFTDPQVLHRQMLVKLQHPKAGPINQIGIPMKFSQTKPEIKTPPPLLGEHTDEILRTLLAYDSKRISELHAKGVV
jgi:crotonobetainyl-CoA:carnitine CoA-transferase CaiB-like acyl-CoA transferase